MPSVLPLRRVIQRLRSHPGVLCLALSLSTISGFARGPEPPLRIRLAPLGFNAISNRYLLEGATMLTVHFVDNNHLLVTFGISKLMKRLPDCPPEDEDRTVKAVLLELPTGKEIAETEWRFHDLGQYLWDLGGGTFMLRQRATLMTFTPLDAPGAGGAFELHPFLKFDRRIEAILVSANHDLLSIETVKKTPPKVESALALPPGPPPAGEASQTAGQSLVLHRRDPQSPEQRADQEEAKPDPAPVEISFVRLTHRADKAERPGPDRIVASIVGRVHTRTAVYLPVTTEGFLETKGTTKDGVLFDFLVFTGKQIELGDFATSCPPKPSFVSPSEFVAFGCRGSDDSPDLAGFNLRGDLIWQMNFPDIHAYPSFVAAVPAGRFALSRTLTISNIFGSETPSMDELTGQEVRVVQMYNGKVLLKVMTSPIQRAGQNFALAPDGMALAIVHDNTTLKGPDPVHDTLHDIAIEIYKLPPLSARDQKEVAGEAALAPEPANAPMRFSMAEIKAALATKPGAAGDEAKQTEDAAGSRRVSQADARIAGDPMSSAVGGSAQSLNTGNGTGIIPSSAAGSGCAVPTKTGETGCPVQSKPKPSEAAADSDPERPRKPPTLYAPGEDHDPPAKPAQPPE